MKENQIRNNVIAMSLSNCFPKKQIKYLNFDFTRVFLTYISTFLVIPWYSLLIYNYLGINTDNMIKSY